jgi:hypothetical protein
MASVVRLAAREEVLRIFCAECLAAALAPRVVLERNMKMKISMRQPVQGRTCTLR